jgi:stage V sporulation protein D (sporulation-specific penicillin-binding protein)
MKPPSKPPASTKGGGVPVQPGVSWRRIRFLFLCVLAFFFAIGAKLFRLQVVGDDELESLAQKQFQRVGKTAPYRAPLLDRNGEELAVSISSSSIFARPRLIRNKRQGLGRLVG